MVEEQLKQAIAELWDIANYYVKKATNPESPEAREYYKGIFDGINVSIERIEGLCNLRGRSYRAPKKKSTTRKPATRKPAKK